MVRKPKVGDVVRLNDEGYESIRPNTQSVVNQARRMTITWVDEESMTFPEETYVIEVDQPDINCFLLNHHMVDLIEEPK